MMFPTKKVDVQRGRVGNLLQTFKLVSKQQINSIVEAGDINAQLLRECLINPEAVEFPVRTKNVYLQQEVNMTQKAMCIQGITTPRMYSVSSC